MYLHDSEDAQTNIIAQIQNTANTKNTKLHVGKSKAGQTEWGRAAVGGGASHPLHSPARTQTQRKYWCL